jgi:small subunit ribosomal protein S29
MKNSNYRTEDFELIHAHDLVLVKHFLSLISSTGPSPALPNGGLVLYSTSASNNPTIYSFEVALKQLAARAAGVSTTSPDYPLSEPYRKIDERVAALFSPGKSSSAKDGQLELQQLGGLSKDEARGLMEYFAHSGILRENVSEEWVGEKWSLAGGGIVGELEKLGRRVRTQA